MIFYTNKLGIKWAGVIFLILAGIMLYLWLTNGFLVFLIFLIIFSIIDVLTIFLFSIKQKLVINENEVIIMMFGKKMSLPFEFLTHCEKEDKADQVKYIFSYKEDIFELSSSIYLNSKRLIEEMNKHLPLKH